MKSMHLCVFPLKNKTKVILFYKKTDRDYKSILHSINAMCKEKKLKYLNYLIFAYTENYYFSPKIGDVLTAKVIEIEEDKNRLIEEARNEVKKMSVRLISQLQSKIHKSARDTLEAIAKSFSLTFSFILAKFALPKRSSTAIEPFCAM